LTDCDVWVSQIKMPGNEGPLAAIGQQGTTEARQVDLWHAPARALAFNCFMLTQCPAGSGWAAASKQLGQQSSHAPCRSACLAAVFFATARAWTKLTLVHIGPILSMLHQPPRVSLAPLCHPPAKCSAQAPLPLPPHCRPGLSVAAFEATRAPLPIARACGVQPCGNARG
jgi:hypothetical protein